MLKIIRWGLLLPVLLLVLPEPASAKIRVVTTLPSFADIAAHVGGPEVEAEALLKGNQDPHFVDAKPSLALRLSKADLLVRAGLGLEDGWLPPLQLGARNAQVQKGGAGDFDVSTVMKLRDVPSEPMDRRMGDVHPGGNPHYMLDPRNGIVLANALADRFSMIDPSKAADFKKRAEAFASEMGRRMKAWEELLKPWKGASVVTYHASMNYLLAWIGVANVATLEAKPGIPPSPEQIVRLVAQMKELKARVILMETYYPKSVAENVAQNTGARLLVIPTEVNATADTPTYASVFEKLVGQLRSVSP